MTAQQTALTRAETVAVLAGPRVIPHAITTAVESKLNNGMPLANAERLNQAVTRLAAAPPTIERNARLANTFDVIVLLASCSLEMAWQQAGDIAIPRPRRLHEHEQSTLNVLDEYLLDELTDPRDRVVRIAVALKDIGKAYCVAVTGANWEQGQFNSRVLGNLMASVSPDVLSPDEQTVVSLLVREESIGRALRGHAEEGLTLDEVLTVAQAGLAELRDQCPAGYRDRFDRYLYCGYLADAAAHTQRAYYLDAATGGVCRDVTDADRATGYTLDGLFSEDPAHSGSLVFRQPAHLAVLRELFAQ